MKKSDRRDICHITLRVQSVYTNCGLCNTGGFYLFLSSVVDAFHMFVFVCRLSLVATAHKQEVSVFVVASCNDLKRDLMNVLGRVEFHEHHLVGNSSVTALYIT